MALGPLYIHKMGGKKADDDDIPLQLKGIQ